MLEKGDRPYDHATDFAMLQVMLRSAVDEHGCRQMQTVEEAYGILGVGRIHSVLFGNVEGGVRRIEQANFLQNEPGEPYGVILLLPGHFTLLVWDGHHYYYFDSANPKQYQYDSRDEMIQEMNQTFMTNYRTGDLTDTIQYIIITRTDLEQGPDVARQRVQEVDQQLIDYGNSLEQLETMSQYPNLVDQTFEQLNRERADVTALNDQIITDQQRQTYASIITHYDKLIDDITRSREPVPAPASGLPRGWVEVVDPRSGQTYYYNVNMHQPLHQIYHQVG